MLLDQRSDPEGMEPSEITPFAVGLSQNTDPVTSPSDECLKKLQSDMQLYVSGLSSASTCAPSSAPSEASSDDAGSEATLATSEATPPRV